MQSPTQEILAAIADLRHWHRNDENGTAFNVDLVEYLTPWTASHRSTVVELITTWLQTKGSGEFWEAVSLVGSLQLQELRDKLTALHDEAVAGGFDLAAPIRNWTELALRRLDKV